MKKSASLLTLALLLGAVVVMPSPALAEYSPRPMPNASFENPDVDASDERPGPKGMSSYEFQLLAHKISLATHSISDASPKAQMQRAELVNQLDPTRLNDLLSFVLTPDGQKKLRLQLLSKGQLNKAIYTVFTRHLQDVAAKEGPWFEQKFKAVGDVCSSLLTLHSFVANARASAPFPQSLSDELEKMIFNLACYQVYLAGQGQVGASFFKMVQDRRVVQIMNEQAKEYPGALSLRATTLQAERESYFKQAAAKGDLLGNLAAANFYFSEHEKEAYFDKAIDHTDAALRAMKINDNMRGDPAEILSQVTQRQREHEASSQLGQPDFYYHQNVVAELQKFIVPLLTRRASQGSSSTRRSRTPAASQKFRAEGGYPATRN